MTLFSFDEYDEYEEDPMVIYVETLTGTTFEVRVSPLETVVGIKEKIQRLEGIPTSQQHLIYTNQELDDDSALQDHSILDGATLKLVLGMRGGPINTRRVTLEDPTLREMADYMEANKEDLLERLPSSKHVTLLVFRNGDQLNFFRVIDRGDGTLTPMSESSSSLKNDNEDDFEEPHSSTEVARMSEKMSCLRAKMEGMKLNRQHKSNSMRSGGPSSSGQRTSVSHQYPCRHSSHTHHTVPAGGIGGSCAPHQHSPSSSLVTHRMKPVPSHCAPPKPPCSSTTSNFTSASKPATSSQHMATNKKSVKLPPINRIATPFFPDSPTPSTGEMAAGGGEAMGTNSQDSVAAAEAGDEAIASHCDVQRASQSYCTGGKYEISQIIDPVAERKEAALPGTSLGSLTKSFPAPKDFNQSLVSQISQSVAVASNTIHSSSPPSTGAVIGPGTSLNNNNNTADNETATCQSDAVTSQIGLLDAGSSSWEPQPSYHPHSHLSGLDPHHPQLSSPENQHLHRSNLDYPHPHQSPTAPTPLDSKELHPPHWMSRTSEGFDPFKVARDILDAQMTDTFLHRLAMLEREAAMPTDTTHENPPSTTCHKTHGGGAAASSPPSLEPAVDTEEYDEDSIPPPPCFEVSSGKRQIFIEKITDFADARLVSELIDKASAKGKVGSISLGKGSTQTTVPSSETSVPSSETSVPPSGTSVPPPRKLSSRSSRPNSLRARAPPPLTTTTTTAFPQLTSALPPLSSTPSRKTSCISKKVVPLTSCHTPSTSSLKRLPSLRPIATPKPPKPRCLVCHKKTRLSNTYSCRCGGTYCCQHRYAEAHECTYDYKREGRKLMHHANPLIQAPKLPKI